MFALQSSISVLGVTYDETMKNFKSRTMVGRTIARVKSRITSLGSITTQPTDKPKPLIAPLAQQIDTLLIAPPRNNPPKSDKGKEKESAGSHNGLLPRIATLRITPSTWTLFSDPTYPRYAATAYVQFTFICEAQNAAHPPPSPTLSTISIISPRTTSPLSIPKADIPPLLSNPPGQLLNLSLNLTTSGPHAILQSFGDTAISHLNPSSSWVYVLHIGIKDTSLASKLTTSWKSLRTRASRSLKRYNLETIDRWLDVLNADRNHDPETDKRDDDVVVKAVVRYQHSFLPKETWLEDVAECKINMSKNGGGQGGGRTGFGLGVCVVDGMCDLAAAEDNDDDEEELDMMEEMVREHNVALGPPFML